MQDFPPLVLWNPQLRMIAMAKTPVKPKRLFLSYSRGDDESFVRRLYQDLTARDFEVWFDRVSMPCRDLTFHQEIRDAIETYDLLLAVIGPKAVESEYVLSEWHHAHLFGKSVVPIIRLGDYGLLPPELSNLPGLDFRNKWWQFWSYRKPFHKLLRILQQPILQPGELLTMVPSPPPHLLQRHDVLTDLSKKVLADVHRPKVVDYAKQVTGIWGMGGIGKTVLASALARAIDTRRSCYDGIVWLTLGTDPDLLLQMRRLGLAFNDQPANYLDYQTAEDSLSKILSQKVCLIVLDDLWKLDHATPFKNSMGPRNRLVFTTREAEIVSAMGSQEISVEELIELEALKLLASWGNQGMDSLPQDAIDVARECGNLPLALATCGAMAKDGISWSSLLSALQKANLSYLDKKLENYKYLIFRSLQVSVEFLEQDNPELPQYYYALAVFPPDENIPEVAVVSLWQEIGLNEEDALKLLTVLDRKTLLKTQGQEPHRLVTVHDLQYDYLQAVAGEGLQVLHGCLLNAYTQKCHDGWATGPNDGYFFEHLAYHLDAAHRQGELRSLLLDYEWLWTKLKAMDVPSLRRDYFFLKEDKALQAVDGALQLSAHVLSHDVAQLPSQLTGRLLSQKSPAILGFLAGIRERHKQSWLRPLTVNLSSPGDTHLATLSRSPNSACSLAFSPDGRRIVCGSYQGVLKIWDLVTSQELQTLKGSKSCFVEAVALSADGRWAVSGYNDNTLIVWDLKTHQEPRILSGHDDPIKSVVVTEDSRWIVSGSNDKTLKVWDIETGDLVHNLEGHTGAVTAVGLSQDGHRAVSGSEDKTLKVWDLETGNELRTLKGHQHSVAAVALSADGRRVVSYSADDTLKVWDLVDWEQLQTLGSQEHSIVDLSNLREKVSALALSLDGHRAVSASVDGVKVWDLETGERYNHKNFVNLDKQLLFEAVALSRDARIAVTSSDHGTNVWDLEVREEQHIPKDHKEGVKDLALSHDSRRAVSISWDGSAMAWDLLTGQEISALDRHYYSVDAVAVTPDGHWAMHCSNNSLIVWDLETDEKPRFLSEHNDSITSVVVTQDSHWIVSGSKDKTLKVWDLETGYLVHSLEGHTDAVTAVGLSLDGHRVVSGSEDKTLKVWNLDTGDELHTLKGHEHSVTAVALSSDGRRAVSNSKDNTVKVWDLENKKALQTIKVEDECVLSTDGRWVLSGNSFAGYLKAWNLENGRELKTRRVHDHLLTMLALSSDGRHAVSCSFDGILKVWELMWDQDQIKCLTVFTADNRLTACKVGSDGRTIVAGDDSGFVHILHLEGV